VEVCCTVQGLLSAKRLKPSKPLSTSRPSTSKEDQGNAATQIDRRYRFTPAMHHPIRPGRSSSTAHVSDCWTAAWPVRPGTECGHVVRYHFSFFTSSIGVSRQEVVLRDDQLLVSGKERHWERHVQDQYQDGDSTGHRIVQPALPTRQRRQPQSHLLRWL